MKAHQPLNTTENKALKLGTHKLPFTILHVSSNNLKLKNKQHIFVMKPIFCKRILYTLGCRELAMIYIKDFFCINEVHIYCWIYSLLQGIGYILYLYVHTKVYL